VLRRYPKHRIVILPQTVYFADKSQEQLARGQFREHRDVHLFARDNTSLQTLEGFSPNLAIAPDMAHQLWPLTHAQPEVPRSLYLFRCDIEKKKYVDIPDGERAVDWQELLSKKDMVFVRQIKIAVEKASTGETLGIVTQLWMTFKEILVGRAASYFAGFDRVVTNRLHGHLLACLMGRKTTLMDNAYFKNAAYHQTWTKYVDDCEFVRPGLIQR